MNDSNKPSSFNNEPRIPLGMNSFGPAARKQFGQTVRLAMECIESKPAPTKGPALPQDESSIRERLKALSKELTSNHADLLELLVRFDDLKGWKSCGASHCAAWMNLEIGISIKLGWEYLRVGRKLQTLSTVQALFRVGKLEWSKVRLITRVATSENEKTLCHAALDASVSDVQRLCEGYRWSDDDNGEGENARVLQQWASRALTWNEASNGSTRIQLVLPPEVAQAFLLSVEQSLNQLGDIDSDTGNTISQSRADAAVLMAETSLQNAGSTISTADRYQVSISIDADELATAEYSDTTHSSTNAQTNAQKNSQANAQSNDQTHSSKKHPAKRPTLYGVGPIAVDTARRIACDCSIMINNTCNGEPISIGRKSRIWTNAMARFIKERDQQCVWPGCTHSHHLHIHHMKHWADGGVTAVHNGVCLCSYHHTLVHEGGYTIERVETDSPADHEQFIQQQHNDDISLFDFEQSLRNDEASFNTVRKLSPTRFRFQILDSQGRAVSGRSIDNSRNGLQVDANKTAHYNVNKSSHHFHDTAISDAVSSNSNAEESTRVDSSHATHADTDQYTSVDSDVTTPAHTNRYSNWRCSEAVPEAYYQNNIYVHAQVHAQAFTYETPSNYGINI